MSFLITELSMQSNLMVSLMTHGGLNVQMDEKRGIVQEELTGCALELAQVNPE